MAGVLAAEPAGEVDVPAAVDVLDRGSLGAVRRRASAWRRPRATKRSRSASTRSVSVRWVVATLYRFGAPTPQRPGVEHGEFAVTVTLRFPPAVPESVNFTHAVLFV